MKKPRKAAKPLSSGPPRSPGQHRRVGQLVEQGFLSSEKDIPRGAILCDPDKVKSSSAMPRSPLWYADTTFVCKDCRKVECWTARQQQWWYEVAGGDIESTAIRCRECRARKRGADAAMTERTMEHRQARAKKKASELATRLAVKGPEGFEVLEIPVATLDLQERVRAVLKKLGFRTVGDLVALEAGKTIPGLRETDTRRIRTLLERQGLTFIGAPVPRP